MNRRLLIIVVVCVTASIAAAWQATARPAGKPLPPPSISTPALRPPIPISASFRHAVDASVVHQLHSSAARLRAQLASTPGSTLMYFAKPLGLAEDQLAVIVRSSMDATTDSRVRAGRWSHAEGATEKRYWNTRSDPALIAEASRWLER